MAKAVNEEQVFFVINRMKITLTAMKSNYINETLAIQAFEFDMQMLMEAVGAGAENTALVTHLVAQLAEPK